MKELLLIPEISESEDTPLVRYLVQVIEQQQAFLRDQTIKIILLEEEIKRFKGHKGRPDIKPSKMEKEIPPPGTDSEKTSDKKKNKNHKNRKKTAQLNIHVEKKIPVTDKPEGSRFKGYESYVVQDLIIQSHNTRYLLERWQLPNGSTRIAELPNEVQGSHFGSLLRSFIDYQYHHQHVTQPLLLEQLRDYGVDISSGQLSHLITQRKDAFHEEKRDILRTGLDLSSYIQTDDTGARHQGKNGYCTHIGNDLFAFFESTGSKSRCNFLRILRQDHEDYALNEAAYEYLKEKKLPAYVLKILKTSQTSEFKNLKEVESHLNQLRIIRPNHIKLITESALMGSLISHGFKKDMRIVSDDAGQFNIFLHGLCWIHAERKIKALVPVTTKHAAEIAHALELFWDIYRDLRTYKEAPSELKAQKIEKDFEGLVSKETGSLELRKILEKLKINKDELLLVLKYPEIPIHNNGSERDIRDYVKKRKISGGTRSENGRMCRDTYASLKKTCRKLKVNFWNFLNDRHRKTFEIKNLSEVMLDLKLARSF